MKKKMIAAMLAAMCLCSAVTASVYAEENVKDLAVFEEGEQMTLKDVIELSKKGNALTWGDFVKYKGVDVGSGLYILEYVLGNGYVLHVGGVPPTAAIAEAKIEYIRLSHGKKSIDIRTDDVEAFIAEIKSENDSTALRGTKTMTIDAVRELAKKGNALDWSDFAEYKGRDIDSGIYIWEFELEDGLKLDVSGLVDRKPDRIWLYRSDIKNGIDIREDSVDDFLHITAYAVMTVTVTDVSGDVMLVTSSGKSGDLFTLSRKYLDDDIEPVVGMKLEVTFSGGILETYPAQFGGVKKVTVVSDDVKQIKGDANCDGGVDMADVVFIMQSLANPDKYQLTETGRINADMDGNGVTVADAQAIQIKLLGLDKETASDIVVFDMAPSKTGVDEFLANNPTIKSSYKDDELFNITPQEITEKYNFRIFKYSSDCESYLEYNGKSYHIGTGFGGFGTVSFAVADIDANGSRELYFTYSFGSGIHSSDVGYFDFATETVSEQEFYYERGINDHSNDYKLRDMVLAVNDNKLELYSAEMKGNSFVELKSQLKDKLGEIMADKDTKKIVFVSVDSSDALTQPQLSDIISIKTPYSPAMSNWSGIGILLEVDSPDHPIFLRAADGHFTEWDIKTGSGPIKNVGNEYDAGKNGYIFWTPDEMYYEDGFNTEIIVAGVSGDVFIDFGRIYITQVEGGKFVASFEKADSTDSSAVAGKKFIYEKEGFGGDCYIEFKEDGTFLYSPGYLSSYLGGGTWEISGNKVILTQENDGMVAKRVNCFRIVGNELIYIEADSDNFIGTKVKDGEKFYVKQSAATLLGINKAKVTGVNVTSLPNGYDFTFTDDKAQTFIDFLSDMELTADFSENPGELNGMTWVIKLEYENGEAMTLYDLGGFIRSENNSWFKYEYDYDSPLNTLIWELGK